MMNALECPKCSGNLETVIYRNVEVDRCERCLGIWFDPQEAEMLRKIAGSESLDLGNIETSDKLSPRTNKDIQCPRCHKLMIQMLDIDRYQLWYEKCPDCQGIWLDAGEFKQFKRNFRSQSLWNLVTSKLSNSLDFWRN